MFKNSPKTLLKILKEYSKGLIIKIKFIGKRVKRLRARNGTGLWTTEIEKMKV